MTYRLSPQAATDLQNIATYLTDKANIEIAKRVITGIREQCRNLATLPGQLGRPRDELGVGIRSFYCRPYVIYFRYFDGLQVVRVLHERRDINGMYFDESE